MRKLLILAIIAAAIYGLYFVAEHRPKLNQIGPSLLMQISSSAFVNNGTIPTKYTCEGENISPPLQFSGVSPDAQSLALVMDDPDSPEGPYTHWLVYNMPVKTKGIGEGDAPPGETIKNSAGYFNYSGPCPIGSIEHTYHFTLYSFDNSIPDTIHNKTELLNNAHILDRAVLLGKYSKSQ